MERIEIRALQELIAVVARAAAGEVFEIADGAGPSHAWYLEGTWIAGSTTSNVWSCSKVDLPA